MFKVTIPHNQEGVPALQLQTESRNLARQAALLGKENKLEVKVVREVEPAPVKFKGL